MDMSRAKLQIVASGKTGIADKVTPAVLDNTLPTVGAIYKGLVLSKESKGSCGLPGVSFSFELATFPDNLSTEFKLISTEFKLKAKEQLIELILQNLVDELVKKGLRPLDHFVKKPGPKVDFGQNFTIEFPRFVHGKIYLNQEMFKMTLEGLNRQLIQNQQLFALKSEQTNKILKSNLARIAYDWYHEAPPAGHQDDPYVWYGGSTGIWPIRQPSSKGERSKAFAL